MNAGKFAARLFAMAVETAAGIIGVIVWLFTA